MGLRVRALSAPSIPPNSEPQVSEGRALGTGPHFRELVGCALHPPFPPALPCAGGALVRGVPAPRPAFLGPEARGQASWGGAPSGTCRLSAVPLSREGPRSPYNPNNQPDRIQTTSPIRSLMFPTLSSRPSRRFLTLPGCLEFCKHPIGFRKGGAAVGGSSEVRSQPGSRGTGPGSSPAREQAG